MCHSVTRRFRCLAAVLLGCLAWAAGATAGPAERLEAQLLTAVEKAVCARNRFAADQVEITLHTRRLPRHLQDATAIDVVVPPHDDAIGPVTVRATFSLPQGEIATIPVPVRVRLFADVLVTRQRLRRHETIAPSALELRRMEITRMAPWVVSDPDSVAGQWAERTINAGRIVDRRWLAPVPLVRRGDRVTMSYGLGAVRVSTAVLAMEDGHRNQTIRIKRPNGNRLLSAIIVDDKTVRPVAP